MERIDDVVDLMLFVVVVVRCLFGMCFGIIGVVESRVSSFEADASRRCVYHIGVLVRSDDRSRCVSRVGFPSYLF